MNWLEFEEKYAHHGLVCGVDESGAGPLAGPVFAAAVILPADVLIEGVNDSKKLTAKRRRDAYPRIIEAAIAYSITSVDNDDIDEINILQARLKAMRLAVEGLNPPSDFALIDGLYVPQMATPCVAIEKGDARSQSIAAASILAKVARDELMMQMHEIYPQYSFNTNKGYGTPAHIAALREHGACSIHRRSFIGGIVRV